MPLTLSEAYRTFFKPNGYDKDVEIDSLELVELTLRTFQVDQSYLFTPRVLDKFFRLEDLRNFTFMRDGLTDVLGEKQFLLSKHDKHLFCPKFSAYEHVGDQGSKLSTCSSQL